MLTARLFEPQERERIAQVYADLRDKAREKGDEKLATQYEKYRVEALSLHQK